MKISEKIKLLIAMIIAFQGLNLAILLHKIVAVHPIMRIVGVLMALGGLWYIMKTVKEKKLEIEEGNLATKLLEKIGLQGELKIIFPIIGILIIVLDLLYNLIVKENPGIGSHDTVVILVGFVLLVYNYIPQKFERERDFALLFISILFLILIIPLTIYSSFFRNPSGKEDYPPFVYYLLTLPLSEMVNLVGIDAVAHGEVIRFESANGGRMSLGITISCAGIYSICIFISAFAAYILTEYKRINRKVVALLGLGILTAYVANLLRMLIIVVVGHYYGDDAMMWTHANVGWVIFMGWIALFWAIMFKYLAIEEKEVVSGFNENI